MRELVYDKTKLPTFKAFYEKIYEDLEGSKYDYYADYPNLCYSADCLNEFLWDFQEEDLVFVMKNFDLDKMKNIKSYDNYKWNIIFKVLNRFVTKYPNNKMIFINDNFENGKKNKELIFDKKLLTSYKNFYEKIYNDLEGIENDYWADYINLCYNLNVLNKFLCDYQENNLVFIMKNFNLDKSDTQKSYDNYKWGLILEVISEFVEEYPNNKMIFINDTDIKG